MLGYKFSANSEKKLVGVHPDLARVIRRALELSEVDFGISEGLRTTARQKQLVAAGASQTMHSRHLTGHAIDVAAYVGGKVRWDWGLYISIANAVRQASIELGVTVKWGGSWKTLQSMNAPITAKMLHKSFPDGPHFEIDPKVYPL